MYEKLLIAREKYLENSYFICIKTKKRCKVKGSLKLHPYFNLIISNSIGVLVDLDKNEWAETVE